MNYLAANVICRRALRAACIIAATLATGCSPEPKLDLKSVADPPTVQVVSPALRTIVREVGQPSFINAYERTSIYPKLTAYIERWIVDIGDKVKKDDVLATLFVPELVEDYATKKAVVVRDRERIQLALRVVNVATADVQTAEAKLDEAKQILAKFQAEVERWDSEVKRLAREVERSVVAPQILLESTNQLKSSTAARDAANAAIAAATANLASKHAALDQAKVSVDVARAELKVAESDEARIKAWVGYLTLTAPFDGVIAARNANTFDFVLPASGDPTAMRDSPHLAPDKAAPIYVVDRVDVVRIFVDVPERDANFVDIGTKASVLVRAYRDEPIAASVTRTSWALNTKSRTLRAEIDIKNPKSELLPGMYAYAYLTIERENVRALPVDTVVSSGGQNYVWIEDGGHARRFEIETGITDGAWIEVTNHRPSGGTIVGTGVAWKPFDGSERVILGDLAILTEGDAINVATASPDAQQTQNQSSAGGNPSTTAGK